MAENEEAENGDIDVSHLLKSVQGIQETLKDGITKNSKADGETDASILLGTTGPATIKSYTTAFKSLHVTTRSAFEGEFQKFFRHPEVQESFDKLLELENAWDQSVVECEVNTGYSNSDAVVPTAGSLGPINIQMVNARTENALMEHQDAIQRLNTKIVVISFGPPHRVRKYLAESGCPFDMLCDEKRELYQSLGLKPPLFRGWRIEQVTRYVEKLALNPKMQTNFENAPEDPAQMGGDYILDKNGCFQFVHTMKTTSDRPTTEEILTTLKAL